MASPRGMPSSRACSVEMPCTSVASAGISRPGSMSPDQLRTTTPPTTYTSAYETGTSVKRSTPVVSKSNPSTSP